MGWLSRQRRGGRIKIRVVEQTEERREDRDRDG